MFKDCEENKWNGMTIAIILVGYRSNQAARSSERKIYQT